MPCRVIFYSTYLMHGDVGDNAGVKTTVADTTVPKPTVKPAKCDAKTGPQQGSCPVAKCAAYPQGCKLKKEFTKTLFGCCPKLCNYVDASGKKCQPGWCGG